MGFGYRKRGEVILGQRCGYAAGNSEDDGQSEGSRGKTRNSAISREDGLSRALNARRSLDRSQ